MREWIQPVKQHATANMAKGNDLVIVRNGLRRRIRPAATDCDNPANCFNQRPKSSEYILASSDVMRVSFAETLFVRLEVSFIAEDKYFYRGAGAG
jgi:hypothetical protein